MRNADRTVTLFNFAVDIDTGYTKSYRTVIGGVSVHSQLLATVDKSGMASADKTVIRIPADSVPATFVRPVVFAALEDKTGYFTLDKESKIVLGMADDESTGPTQLEKKYGREYCVSILGVTDNRDKREPHWKVTCE